MLRALLLRVSPGLVFTACSSALSTIPNDPPPEDPPRGVASNEPSGPAGFFDCADLAHCKELCDRDLWDGCMGAYVRSDKSSPEKETAARVYLEKACKLGQDLACTMLEPADPKETTSKAP